MKTKTINVLTTEEIAKINADNITCSASEREHINTIEEIAKMLLKEVEQYKNSVKDKYNHENYEDTNVKLTISDYLQFDGKQFEKEHPELYKVFKTKSIHKEIVTIK